MTGPARAAASSTLSKVTGSNARRAYFVPVMAPPHRTEASSRAASGQCRAPGTRVAREVRDVIGHPTHLYSRLRIASAGCVRSARRVGTDRATRARSAETPRIAASQPAGA